MITIVKLNGITNVDLVIDKWWPSGTDLLPCDWVACLQPPQAPAFTNLRHTGWWVLIISKTNNHQNRNPQNQVWRSDSIWRECEFCLWEGDGLWGGLSSNLLWSHLSGSPIKIFGTQHRCGNRVWRYQTNQDGSESGSTKGYFLVPEDDEWPNCVRGDPATHSTSFSKKNIETTVNWQVHCAVPLQRFRLRGALKWYRAPFKSTPYLAARSKKSLDQVISCACSFKACKLVLEQTEGFHWETCSQVAGPLVSNVGGPATIQLSCPSYLSVFLQVSHFRCTRSSSSSRLNTDVERAKMSCAMGRRTRQVNYFHHFVLQQHSPRGYNPSIHQWSRISTKAPSVDCIDSSLLHSWRSQCLASHNCSFQGSTFYHDRRLGHGRMLMLKVMVVYGDQIFLEATTNLSKAQH